MLPSELLFSRRRGAHIYPKFLRKNQQRWAESVLNMMQAHQHRTRGELLEALKVLEGDSPDYRIVRGFAHLALNAAKFTLAVPDVAPEVLRHEVFSLASQRGVYNETQAQTVLKELSEKFQLDPDILRHALYADLPERHVLSVLPDYPSAELVDRYNVAQAQGLLYSALYLRVWAHRNVPGEYRRLFQQLKFHGLMYAVEGNLDDGYQVYVDGPASLFKLTRKYGIQMALFLPALLRITRWEMEAVLRKDDRELTYSLNSESPLRSHYAKAPAYDSLLEKSFAERWEKLQLPWVLEREVEIVDLKGTVFVPDFALRHEDGRTVHIEIVGFWHPDYLRRKLDKVKRANMQNLLLAVSDRLNVSKEAVKELPGSVLFFKGKLEPKGVLEIIETMDLKR